MPARERVAACGASASAEAEATALAADASSGIRMYKLKKLILTLMKKIERML